MFSAYLQIDNMAGESTDSQHKNWIELQKFEIAGLQQQSGQSLSQGGALTAGRSTLEPFSVVKLTDKASPKIFDACMKGTHIPKITLSVCRQTGSSSGATEFIKYEITNAMVVGFHHTGDASSTRTEDNTSSLPTEEVKFIGVTHSITYTETDTKGEKKGSVVGKYDLSQNK